MGRRSERCRDQLPQCSSPPGGDAPPNNPPPPPLIPGMPGQVSGQPYDGRPGGPQTGSPPSPPPPSICPSCSVSGGPRAFGSGSPSPRYFATTADARQSEFHDPHITRSWTTTSLTHALQHHPVNASPRCRGTRRATQADAAATSWLPPHSPAASPDSHAPAPDA